MADTPQTHPDLHQVEATWSPYHRVSPGMRARMRRWWNGQGFNPDVASKLRYEMDMLLLRTRCRLGRAYRAKVRGLRSRRNLLVHLGCGNALFDGWINLDCYPPDPKPGIEILTLDMRRGLPFADGSVAALFSEHFLEHLPRETVRDVILPEIRRVLAPGGSVRIGVPDGEYFVDQYVASRKGAAEALYDENRGSVTPMTMLNDIGHGHGHYFVYDFETLGGMMRAVGFVDVRRARPGDTRVPQFSGRDREDAWRRAMTLYVEAAAPGAS
ncbi:MAG TPA: methyltransferase domain-containing protein [Candidatus Polarisedimenticolaceae bacterium]|nr:methyltransferase domain-containing protein [Candidatus Polarisedimenticolaceae bacterium]